MGRLENILAAGIAISSFLFDPLYVSAQEKKEPAKTDQKEIPKGLTTGSINDCVSMLAMDINTQLKRTLAEDKEYRVALGPFIDSKAKAKTMFCEVLENTMISHILTFSTSEDANKKYCVVENKNLEALVKELKIQSSALFDEKTAARLGRMMGAQAIIIGDVTELSETEYLVQARVVEVETGKLKASSYSNLSLKAKPAETLSRKVMEIEDGRLKTTDSKDIFGQRVSTAEDRLSAKAQDVYSKAIAPYVDKRYDEAANMLIEAVYKPFKKEFAEYFDYHKMLLRALLKSENTDKAKEVYKLLRESGDMDELFSRFSDKMLSFALKSYRESRLSSAVEKGDYDKELAADALVDVNAALMLDSRNAYARSMLERMASEKNAYDSRVKKEADAVKKAEDEAKHKAEQKTLDEQVNKIINECNEDVKKGWYRTAINKAIEENVRKYNNKNDALKAYIDQVSRQKENAPIKVKIINNTNTKCNIYGGQKDSKTAWVEFCEKSQSIETGKVVEGDCRIVAEDLEGRYGKSGPDKFDVSKGDDILIIVITTPNKNLYISIEKR
jgi:pentatricopeptide repeat protein